MRIRIDTHSGEPIYRQIVEQVKYQAAAGRIESGARLPSIRVLADQLKINPRTVVRAYEELQAAGLVVMRHGQGVFLAERRHAVPAAERRRALRDLARRLVAEAARLGASPEELRDLVEKEIEEMEEPS